MDRANIWLVFFGLIILVIVFIVIGFMVNHVIVEWDEYF